jgi:hypothetical protein
VEHGNNREEIEFEPKRLGLMPKTERFRRPEAAGRGSINGELRGPAPMPSNGRIPRMRTPFTGWGDSRGILDDKSAGTWQSHFC